MSRFDKARAHCGDTQDVKLNFRGRYSTGVQSETETSSPVPIVSIGLPVFNAARFVDRCIESIVNQTLRDFELIVCDNASTDGTAEIAKDWARTDSRIRFYQAQENRGAASNFNWSYTLARAELFKWCSADDYLAKDFLQLCVRALERDQSAVLAHSGVLDVDETDQVIGEIYDNRAGLQLDSPDCTTRFRDLVCMDHSCTAVFGVIRASALSRTSKIAPYYASDKVLLAQLGLQGTFIRINRNLMYHRQYSGRAVNANPTPQKMARWFDPNIGMLVFPHYRLAWEFTRAALRSRLVCVDRLRCVFQVLNWIRWGGWKGLISDIVYYFRRH